MQINIIEFISQAVQSGWVNQGNNADKPTKTRIIGFVAKETDELVQLVQGFNNFKQDFNVMNISKSQILERKELKQIKEDFETFEYKEVEIQKEEPN